MPPRGTNRRFLFLQGPHGPFFGQLADRLRKTGAQCWQVGFNAGDAAFWGLRDGFIAHRTPQEEWPHRLERLTDDLAITDIVLYGDARPVHRAAADLARRRGLTLHVFEEGYLRPWWVTYERGGSNGNSPLMRFSMAEISARLGQSGAVAPRVPAHWGDLRQHIFYGALYHGLVLAGGRRWRNWRPHRDITVAREFRLQLRNLLLMPWHWGERRAATRRIRRGGFPFHLVLLQLDHDAAFRTHSHLSGSQEFIETVIHGFAEGAPSHHHLVFKAHPLEDGRVPLRRLIRRSASAAGVGARVHFVRGGKLAELLDTARTAVTVNSTSAQQALWRGLPVRAFGKAVYCKPELVSSQPIAEFFGHPQAPDTEAYRLFRQFLLATCQVPGGYYSARGRRQLLREIVDRILDERGPYERPKEAPLQHLRLVN